MGNRKQTKKKKFKVKQTDGQTKNIQVRHYNMSDFVKPLVK